MRHYRVLAFLAVFLLAFQYLGTAQQLGSSFTNPLLDNGPDPWVTRHNGYYYYMNTMGNRLVIRKTKVLSQVSAASATTVWTPPATGPNSGGIWAPELHFQRGKWYLYYTAADAQKFNDDTRGVFVLENSAADPTTGQWIDRGKINTRYPGLDGSVFEDRGQLYFLYSAYVGPQSVLCIAPMQNPWTLLADKEVVIATPTYTWEKGGGRQILEGPEFLRGKKGQVFIVYSASACWDDNYSLGMLTASGQSDLLQASSWTKSSEPVFCKSVANSVYGPGHNSFTTSPNGRQDWIVYHAKDAPTGKCEQRSLRMQPFSWNPDGTPRFGAPVSTKTVLSWPVGQ
ncbi:glycoside hydrolase family 43 protein [Hymenobacter sp. GOD-10R]|uniref:glycoside hydrolase family 43 protein n=1 Tax=Hymenobacter sp. GOD-10R TaxID=3093922 RepID=UPI002D7A401E|nr:glycoside hydrolase family 43 protein [Hymenobacter sp. GOD-10R]WRQ27123.1 glycoside hydrolase family 43 protein [Hymenobacter sp. GOD-10R]